MYAYICIVAFVNAVNGNSVMYDFLQLVTISVLGHLFILHIAASSDSMYMRIGALRGVDIFLVYDLVGLLMWVALNLPYSVWSLGGFLTFKTVTALRILPFGVIVIA